MYVVPMFVMGAIIMTWISDEITNYGLGNGTAAQVLLHHSTS